MKLLRWASKLANRIGREQEAELVSRREFGRRLFAMGAGIAMGGALIRQASLSEIVHYGGIASLPDGGYIPSDIRRLHEALKRAYAEPFTANLHEEYWFLDDLREPDPSWGGKLITFDGGRNAA